MSDQFIVKHEGRCLLGGTGADRRRSGPSSGPALAESITWAASRQTYLTIRFSVDRERVPQAYQAYSYFRWVDDCLDQDDLDKPQRLAFLARQQKLLIDGYQGVWPDNSTQEELLLEELIRSDPTVRSGLRSYLHHMMAVMSFDAHRRGLLVSQKSIEDYSRSLAIAVTDALHYFIGGQSPDLSSDGRYSAALGAHITHMLRDTWEDLRMGYFNIPEEFLSRHGITPQDVHSAPYRDWVKERVALAREHFQSGKRYLARVPHIRCRLAGYGYIARFEQVLDVIEREHFMLRDGYRRAGFLGTSLRSGQSLLVAAMYRRGRSAFSRASLP